MAFLQRADTKLYHEIAGSGAPLLLIQGVGACGEAWRPQVEGLRGEFQTLLFDNRGLGRSLPNTGPVSIPAMAEDARALMDEAGWESAHVVGHSMGGLIAQQLALDAPGRVRSLALLCTFSKGPEAARVTPWVLWMTLRTRLGSRAMRRKAFLEMLFPPGYLRTVDSGECAERVAKLVGRDLADSPPILMKQVMAMGRHDVAKKLGSLAGIPTLVVSGEKDPIAPPLFGRALAAAIPGAQFEEMKGASHGLTIDRAKEINGRLREFLSTVPPRPKSPGK